MFKKLFFLIFLLNFFTLTYTAGNECEKTVDPTGLSDCKSKNTGDKDYYCCYTKASLLGVITNSCHIIFKEDWKDRTKKSVYESLYDKIECSSNYLKIGLLSLVAIFFY